MLIHEPQALMDSYTFEGAASPVFDICTITIFIYPYSIHCLSDNLSD